MQMLAKAKAKAKAKDHLDLALLELQLELPVIEDERKLSCKRQRLERRKPHKHKKDTADSNACNKSIVSGVMHDK